MQAEQQEALLEADQVAVTAGALEDASGILSRRDQLSGMAKVVAVGSMVVMAGAEAAAEAILEVVVEGVVQVLVAQVETELQVELALLTFTHQYHQPRYQRATVSKQVRDPMDGFISARHVLHLHLRLRLHLRHCHHRHHLSYVPQAPTLMQAPAPSV